MISIILYIQLIQDLTNKTKLVGQIYSSNVHWEARTKIDYKTPI